MKNLIVLCSLLFTFHFNSSAQGWEALTSIPEGLAFPLVVNLNGNIHVIGGGGPSGATDLHLRYQAATNKWDTLAPVPYLAQQPAGAVLNGKIHYFGGGYPNSGTPLDSHYVYDPGTNSWSAAAHLLKPRVIMKAAVTNGKLYALGGQPDKARMDMYNPSTDSWKQMNDLPDASFWYSALVTHNDKMYRFGGGGFLGPVAAVHEYDTANDSWTNIDTMPKALHAPAGTVLNDKVYISGGYNAGPLSEVYIYDIAKKQFSNTYSLPDARSYHDMVTIDTCIYVIGGNNNSQPDVKTSLLRLCNPQEVNLSVAESQTKFLQIYPNPASDYVIFETDLDEDATVSFYDITGQLQWETKLHPATDRLEIQALSQGMYFYRISSGTRQMLGRLVVVR